MKECPICHKQKKKYEFSLKDKNVCRLCYKPEPEPIPEPKPTNKIKCSTCKKTKHKSNFVLKTKCIQCQSDFVPKQRKEKEKPIKREVTLFDLQQLEKEKLAQGYKWKTVIIDRIKTRKLVKGMKANDYFKSNLEALKKGNTHQARAKYKDGTPATKTSIYNVFEKYGINEVPVHGFRSTAVKLAIQEMLWIYKDQTSCLKAAHKRGITWWDDFNVGDNSIGYAYGWVVESYELIDTLLDGLANNPFSNRHIMSLWDAYFNKEQDRLKGLVPCAHTTTYNVVQLEKSRLLNMQLTIRSSDYITAGAINRVQYYALGLMICGHLEHITGIRHDLQFSVLTNDLHIYDRHLFAIDELLQIEPVNEPVLLRLKEIKSFYDYDIKDFIITKKETYKLSKKLELAI